MQTKIVFYGLSACLRWDIFYLLFKLLQLQAWNGFLKINTKFSPGVERGGGGEDLTHLLPSCRLLCGQFALYYAPCRCTLLVFTWCIWTVGKTEQINVWWSRLRYVSQAACGADPLVINERNLTGIQVMDGIA